MENNQIKKIQNQIYGAVNVAPSNSQEEILNYTTIVDTDVDITQATVIEINQLVRSKQDDGSYKEFSLDDNDGYFVPGEEFEYIIDVTNITEKTLHGVTIIDAIPIALEFNKETIIVEYIYIGSDGEKHTDILNSSQYDITISPENQDKNYQQISFGFDIMFAGKVLEIIIPVLVKAIHNKAPEFGNSIVSTTQDEPTATPNKLTDAKHELTDAQDEPTPADHDEPTPAQDELTPVQDEPIAAKHELINAQDEPTPAK
ncbi:hypothetical protein AN641_07205 [Candidatus Epulonipiscioides gigas]|nr:hypothetical protein AN641_07205 [Epulopiscium sp. SCG-C07WGA-EpuloA2]